jgi:protein-S-isoprenylcysteine O-methyltransferase Ste14
VSESFPKFTLAGYALFVLVSGGGRVWLQHRWTGDTGLRPMQSRVERASFALFLLGTIVAPLAVLFELAGHASPLHALRRPSVQLLAVALFALGFTMTVVAQIQMGASWRIGVRATERTTLVTGGLFRVVRNPIFTGVMLAIVSLFLTVPNAWTASSVLCIGLALELHVRRVEEPYLLRAHGDAYRTYARSAGRFVPGVGRGVDSVPSARDGSAGASIPRTFSKENS